jgi:hypothetical protein
MDEMEQPIRATPQASKTAIQQRADFMSSSWSSILQVLFDIAMTVFFRIKLRGIGRQWLNYDFWMLSQKSCGLATDVNAGAVPDQNKTSGQMSLQMAQGFNDLSTLHPTFKMPLVNLARESQPYRRRYAAAVDMLRRSRVRRGKLGRCPRGAHVRATGS